MNPTEHAVPHRLHENPIFSFPVGSPGTDLAFLGIKDGRYEFYMTNHALMTLVVALVLIAVGLYCARRIGIFHGQDLARYQTKGRVAQLFEMVCSFVRDEVAYPNLKGLTDKYIYFIWTVFFFILFANIIGVIPIGYGLQLLTGDSHYTHFGGTATGNLAMTGVLALISLFMIIWVGIRETSPKEFFNHFNPIGWGGGLGMVAIGCLLYFLEWLGLLIKCFVLAMRLFGTMMAGHLVLAAFVGLIFVAGAAGEGLGYMVAIPVVLISMALTLLELFVCCLQAFIFTFLTVLFIAATAVHEHGHDEDHDHQSDANQMDVDKIFDPSRISPTVGASRPAMG